MEKIQKQTKLKIFRNQDFEKLSSEVNLFLKNKIYVTHDFNISPIGNFYISLIYIENK